MIITQTPLRISFAGGGTDLEAFYKLEPGCVISSAIDKYIYVIIKERFDNKIRVGYSRTEMVDEPDQVEHELVREALKKTGIRHGVEIATMADIPSEGSGLGSSSTVTVGLLNAMYLYQGVAKTAEHLAAEACDIEIRILGKPIGKQDQYIAAYGGMRMFEFNPNDSVTVHNIDLTDEMRRRLGEHLMLFYTGIARKADSVLTEQKQNTEARLDALRTMKRQAFALLEYASNGQFSRFGETMRQGWELKKTLADKVSNSAIDDMYNRALEAGALGGKITGAGGGGFMLLYCPPERQAAVRGALRDLRELSFALERDGTKAIFNCRR
jgi:D-glycero-alpha-D-manno-heptose-7-phosphate kinase